MLAIGVSKTLYHYWKTGQRSPSPEKLRRIIELEKEAGIAPPPPVVYPSATPSRELKEEPSGMTHAISKDLELVLAEMSRIGSAIEHLSVELGRLNLRFEQLHSQVREKLNIKGKT